MSRATAVTLVFMTQYSYSVSTCIGLSVCGTRHTLFVAHVCQRKGCTFFDASRSALSSSLVATHTGRVARDIRFATWRACKPPLDGTRSALAQSAAASRRTAATRQRIAIGAESAGIAKYSCTDQSPVRSSPRVPGRCPFIFWLSCISMVSSRVRGCVVTSGHRDCHMRHVTVCPGRGRVSMWS